MLESELSLIASVRDNTALKEEYYNAAYLLGTEFTKGRLAAIGSDPQFASIVASSFGAGSVTDYSGIGGAWSEMEDGKPAATGLERVPYDNFPALLHEGERVLTAAEARSYNSGSPVTVTGNTFVVRQDSDIDAIAAAISEKIRMARLAGVT